MRRLSSFVRILLFKSLLALLMLANAAFAADPLPSWNDTGAKKAIIGSSRR